MKINIFQDDELLRLNNTCIHIQLPILDVHIYIYIYDAITSLVKMNIAFPQNLEARIYNSIITNYQ